MRDSFYWKLMIPNQWRIEFGKGIWMRTWGYIYGAADKDGVRVVDMDGCSRYGRSGERYNIYFKMREGVVLEMEVLNPLPTMSEQIYMQKF